MITRFIWSCGRKHRHKYRDVAERKLQEGKDRNWYDDKFEVYGCTFCGGYHIGKKKDAKPAMNPENWVKVPLTVLDDQPIAFIEEGYAYIKNNPQVHKLIKKGWVGCNVSGLQMLRKKLPEASS